MSGENRIVIVGAGPAGLSAARAYREAGGGLDVVMLAAEAHHPYSRPPLTKEYLRSEHGRADLFMEEPGFYAEHGIDLRTRTPAARLDTARRLVVTGDGEELSFTGCVLATGSQPLRLPVPGGDHEDLLTVRELEDSERLQAQAAPGAAVTVVGSGFIGCEAAVSIATRGASVTLVSDEEAPQSARLGEEVGTVIAGWLEQAGVRTRFDAKVESFEENGRCVVTAGEQIRGDVTVVATGVSPRIGLAEEAGIAIEEGRVRTDASMRTSAEGVFAAGDIAFAQNPVAGRRLAVEHWGEALAHGEVAGNVLAGQDARWEQAPGFWSAIGEHTLKYVAWGDGHDEVRLESDDDGSFTAWYGREGVLVGVLTHERDDDYERGRELVESGAQLA
ncbi:MAG: FAD/NAD(P)-binding oxidoreductase [Thermoleophilaceae bacterium]